MTANDAPTHEHCRRPWTRGVGLVLLGVVVGLAPVACSDDGSDDEEATDFSGVLAEPASADGAFTYDAAAPSGGEMTVTVTEGDEATTFALEVTGFEPDRSYAVHAHVNPCGPTGDDAGPHFQDEVDPAATPDEPSADPAYANPDNEVWLDLATDADGDGSDEAEVPFALGDEPPASIVVHEAMETATEPGEAGMAGDRIACLDTPLR